VTGLLPPEIVELARRVVEENARIGRRVALAESCTGGLVGFVTYSNDAKMQELDVSSEIIETFGAVSIACVWAMAQGALTHSNADVAVAISGVAGPDGGTALKPVGTVVFARACCAAGSEPEGELRQFDGMDRSEIRRQATLAALDLLLP
jgi:nicotinamide-nucleotide amidase